MSKNLDNFISLINNINDITISDIQNLLYFYIENDIDIKNFIGIYVIKYTYYIDINKFISNINFDNMFTTIDNLVYFYDNDYL